MPNLTDMQLAVYIYWQLGISVDRWQAHWRVDSGKHGNLLKGARAAYVRIFNSYQERNRER